MEKSKYTEQTSQTSKDCGTETRIVIQKKGWYVTEDSIYLKYDGYQYIGGNVCTLYENGDKNKIQMFFTTGKPLLADNLSRIVKYLPKDEYPELYL